MILLELSVNGEEVADEPKQKTDACAQAGTGNMRQTGRKPEGTATPGLASRKIKAV